MMEPEEIRRYCLAKPKAYETFPFGEAPVCYKVNGRIFAQLYPDRQDYKITVKCTMSAGDFYRRLYPGKVVRGYHCPPVQQPYWNTVCLSGFPDDELKHMIDLAYDTVWSSFTRKERERLMEE